VLEARSYIIVNCVINGAVAEAGYPNRLHAQETIRDFLENQKKARFLPSKPPSNTFKNPRIGVSKWQRLWIISILCFLKFYFSDYLKDRLMQLKRLV